MGQVLHGSATTSHAERSAIQRLRASLAQLSRELGNRTAALAEWHGFFAAYRHGHPALVETRPHLFESTLPQAWSATAEADQRLPCSA